MNYKTIESWHGTGPCKTVKIVPPIKGHSIVSEIRWFGGGGYNVEVFPGDRKNQTNSPTALFVGSLEENGYQQK